LILSIKIIASLTTIQASEIVQIKNAIDLNVSVKNNHKFTQVCAVIIVNKIISG